MNRKIAFTILELVFFSGAALSQVPPKDAFIVHIMKITRIEEGCSVVAEAPAVRFTVTSDMPAPCGMLRAGQTYKAFRAMLQNDRKDETKDSAILIIYNNVENARRSNAGFDIQSEETLTQK